jgi:hypothetical protein
MTPGVRVAALDTAGSTVTSFTDTVSLALGSNPKGGRLYGTLSVAARNGVATFSDLTVDSAATGYTLRANATNLHEAGSAAFAVAAAPAIILAAAGDIASCPGSGQAETAALLASVPVAGSNTVVALGDNAYPNGSLTDYQTCYAPAWGPQKARTRPVPGNHDYTMTGGAPGYWQYFTGASPTVAVGDSGDLWYSYDLGTWHIIAVNSEASVDTGSSQEAWLRADLAAHTKPCTLAYWHRPRFSSGSTHGSAAYMQPVWQDLYDAGADVVLSGHEHNYERFAPQRGTGAFDAARGIREFVVGTGGAGLYNHEAAPLPNSEVFNGTTWGVLKLTLYASSYTWEFVPVAGGAFADRGSGACH